MKMPAYVRAHNKKSNQCHIPMQPNLEKMTRINYALGTYKRSSNNSHKKFMSIARKVFFRGHQAHTRQAFDAQFILYKQSRAYFFIILAHVKIRMTPQQRNQFFQTFMKATKDKIELYQKEMGITKNKDFSNFRNDEITELEYALDSAGLYFSGHTAIAIEKLYRRQKANGFKSQHFEATMVAITQLQSRLRNYPPGQLFPYMEQKKHRGRRKSTKVEQSKVAEVKIEEVEPIAVNQQAVGFPMLTQTMNFFTVYAPLCEYMPFAQQGPMSYPVYISNNQFIGYSPVQQEAEIKLQEGVAHEDNQADTNGLRKGSMVSISSQAIHKSSDEEHSQDGNISQ